MQMENRRILAFALSTVMLSACAFAVPQNITDVTGIVFDAGDGTITRIDTDGTEGGQLPPEYLVGVTLTGFVDPDTIPAALAVGGSMPAVKASLVEDGSLDTALANVSSMTFAFNRPIVNRPGAEIILIDLGASNDELTVTINAVSKVIAAGSQVYATAARPYGSWISNTAGPFNTVADLNSVGFNYVNEVSTLARNVVLIDLDDFSAASATSLTITTANYDLAVVLGIRDRYLAAPVEAVTYDQALVSGRMAADTDYNLTSITVNGVTFDKLEGGVSANATSANYVFGTHSSNDGGEYSNKPGAVSGLNMAFALADMSAGGTWHFSRTLDKYIGFAFFELTGNNAMQLRVVDADDNPVGTLSLTLSVYGVDGDAGLSPVGGWFTPTFAQVGEFTGPAGLFFTVNEFQGSGDWSTATGFRLEGAAGIDPFVMLGVTRIQGSLIMMR